jgi:hypothetical protein
MSYRVDVQSAVQFFGEADTVISDAQAKLTFCASQLFDLALTGFGEAMKAGEDSHRSITIEATNIQAGALGLEDASHV